MRAFSQPVEIRLELSGRVNGKFRWLVHPTGAILLAMADAIAVNAGSIREANQADLEESGLAGAMRERLLLTPERIATMVSGVREVAGLPEKADPDA